MTDPIALLAEDSFSEETSAEPDIGESEKGEPSAGDRLSGYVGLALAGMLSTIIFVYFNWPQPDGWGDLLRPLLLIDSTPSGGDMGAHVWGPAYLRDHLLPQGRLSGWTPDWYAGFPAYHFYMVVPPLAIIAVNAGFPWFIGLPLAIGVLYAAYRFGSKLPLPPTVVNIAAVIVAIMLVGVPYGVAFKLVSVTGLVAFPLAAWKMARLAGATEPVPAFVSLASFVFLFDTNFTIYGGNIASTLAGEFSFSICLMLTLLAIGMSADGMDSMRRRASAAVVLGLVAMTHVLPVFFLIVAVGLMVLLHRNISRAWAVAGTVALALVPISLRDGVDLGPQLLAVGAVVVVLASAMVADRGVWQRARWLLVAGPVSILLASFWLVPFILRRDFFNDMGWERVDHVGPALLTVPMKIALPIAAIGLVLSYVSRERLGMMFGGTGIVFAAAVANLGEGPVWNARLLPFYYLSVYMLAAIGVALILRLVASMVVNDLDLPDGVTMAVGTSLVAVGVLVAVAMPLRILPGGNAATGDGSYEWLAFSNTKRSFVPSWIEWNYSGYENKDSYAEYRQVVSTMDEVGETNGCGRAMWEHHEDLDRYGTPMALMLLPHWTDGCIGSMEGLYFESSASTPFHFLNQSLLSEAPSRPQRNLPYLGFDIERGVAQLQSSGVRYYMAQTDVAIAAARNHPDLTEMTEAPPFVVFEVAGSELVEGLDVEPLVVSGPTEDQVEGFEESSRFEIGWISQAIQFYNNPNGFRALPAEDGPAEWERAETLDPVAGETVIPAAISDIEAGNDSISFTVDEVGKPVLVKISYFPNWSASGAEGPWRVGPNMMAVIPTDTSVTLTYGRSVVDLLGILLTLLGIGGVAALYSVDRGRLGLSRLMAGFSGGGVATDVPEVEGHDVSPDGRDTSPDVGDMSLDGGDKSLDALALDVEADDGLEKAGELPEQNEPDGVVEPDGLDEADGDPRTSGEWSDGDFLDDPDHGDQAGREK